MSQSQNTTQLFASIRLLILLVAISLTPTHAATPITKTAANKPAEAKLAPFLGQPKFDMQQVFKNERFPNITTAVDGTILASWGQRHVRLRRSTDGGKTYGPEIIIKKPGFQSGGMTVNEKNGHIFAFVEERHPPAPIHLFVSTDNGKTWKSQKTTIHKDVNGKSPSMHMNESGITLRRGPHAGRLIRPSRNYNGKNAREQWPNHYTNAIYSDDNGKTWHTSKPFPENGTGEAALVELSNGDIYYNSRIHWPARPIPTRRRSAISKDGGVTWINHKIVHALPDGQQNRAYGCMGGLTRLPVLNKDILIFSNLDTKNPRRERGTVWASFDGGKTWPVKRLVYKGTFGYSSLTSGRPQTPSEGYIYLHFEYGPKGGSTIARFNLAWLLKGTPTGNGKIPDWASK